MQAHTLGEVGNLGTVSLRVSSGTILPIFIQIGSYLTDKEQKIRWHSFFETRCINEIFDALFAGCYVSESVLLQFSVCLQCCHVDNVCEISAEMPLSYCHGYKHRFKLIFYCKWHNFF